jgi:hypothetical protein
MVKLFAWLVLVDRLNTKTMLTLHHTGGARENDLCVMCTEGREETCEHLFSLAPLQRNARPRSVSPGTSPLIWMSDFHREKETVDKISSLKPH